MPQNQIPQIDQARYLSRTVTAVAVAITGVVLVLMLWMGLQTLLLAFAGVLVGVLLRGCAEGLTSKTGLPHGVSLVAVALLILLSVGALLWTAGEQIATQVGDVLRRVPESADRLEAYAARQPMIRKAFDLQPPADSATQPSTGALKEHSEEAVLKMAVGASDSLGMAATPVPSGDEDDSGNVKNGNATYGATTRPDNSGSPIVARVVQAGGGSVATTATRAVAAIVNGALNLIVVVIVAVYVAASPTTYVAGVLRLVPISSRPRAAEVLDALGRTLWHWLKGQGVTMTVIGVITGVGLWFIGIEQWLVLGLLTALFNFIPNLGPFISYVPAVLIALTVSTDKAIAVTVLYLIAQSLEGYILTPLVQRKAVDIPPALLIVAQVLAGVFGGALGVMLAAPLTSIVLVMIRMLYVRDALGDDLQRPVPEASRGNVARKD